MNAILQKCPVKKSGRFIKAIIIVQKHDSKSHDSQEKILV